MDILGIPWYALRRPAWTSQPALASPAWPAWPGQPNPARPARPGLPGPAWPAWPAWPSPDLVPWVAGWPGPNLYGPPYQGVSFDFATQDPPELRLCQLS